MLFRQLVMGLLASIMLLLSLTITVALATSIGSTANHWETLRTFEKFSTLTLWISAYIFGVFLVVQSIAFSNKKIK